MTVSDLIRVDHAGNVVEGGRPGRQIVNLAGFTIHHAIHVARPDVLAICHSHSTYGKAYATLGKPLEITTQDSCSFYNDVAHLADFGGVVIESKESASITDALGAKKAIILQSHGLLTVGGSIESAVAWFIMLEKQCEVALLADAAAAGRGGKVVPIDEPQAACVLPLPRLPLTFPAGSRTRRSAPSERATSRRRRTSRSSSTSTARSTSSEEGGLPRV